MYLVRITINSKWTTTLTNEESDYQVWILFYAYLLRDSHFSFIPYKIEVETIPSPRTIVNHLCARTLHYAEHKSMSTVSLNKLWFGRYSRIQNSLERTTIFFHGQRVWAVSSHMRFQAVGCQWIVRSYQKLLQGAWVIA